MLSIAGMLFVDKYHYQPFALLVSSYKMHLDAIAHLVIPCNGKFINSLIVHLHLLLPFSSE
jgi:hypothetical protein